METPFSKAAMAGIRKNNRTHGMARCGTRRAAAGSSSFSLPSRGGSFTCRASTVSPGRCALVRAVGSSAAYYSLPTLGGIPAGATTQPPLLSPLYLSTTSTRMHLAFDRVQYRMSFHFNSWPSRQWREGLDSRRRSAGSSQRSRAVSRAFSRVSILLLPPSLSFYSSGRAVLLYHLRSASRLSVSASVASDHATSSSPARLCTRLC